MVTFIEVSVTDVDSTILLNTSQSIDIRKVENGPYDGYAKISVVNDNRDYINNVYYTDTEDYDTFIARLETGTTVTIVTP